MVLMLLNIFFQLWLKSLGYLMGMSAVFVSVAVRTCKVTMLLHCTAAFLLKLGHQLCGAVHSGNDAAVWRAASHWEREEKRGWLDCDGALCNQSYRAVIVKPRPFEHGCLWYANMASEFSSDVMFIYGSARCCGGERKANDRLMTCMCWPWSSFHISHLSKTISS